MANVFGDGTWILDTQDQTKCIERNSVSVKKIIWQPAAADDALIIKNAAGDTIISETALAAYPAGKEVYDFNPSLQIDGFMLHTLTVTGKIYVHLG